MKRPPVVLPLALRVAAFHGLFAIVVLLIGCKPSEDAAQDIAVTWEVSPDPPRVGNATVAVTLADSLGRPVRDANITLEGAMTHPGMQPVMAEAHEVVPGRYEATMNLTMGGDWMLLLHAALPDGRSVQRQKDLHGVRAP